MGQLVVLGIVAAHQNPQARRGAELTGPGLALEATLFAALAQVTALHQLGADVVEILLRLRLIDLLTDTFQIGKLGISLFYLLRQYFFGGFRLGVLFEIPVGIFPWGQAHVQGDLNGGAALFIVVLHRHGAHATLHTVEVGDDQLAAKPQGLPVTGLGQLLFLHGQLAAEAGGGVGDGFHQILALLLHPLRLLPADIVGVQQFGEGVVGHVLGIFPILEQRLVCKVNYLVTVADDGGQKSPGRDGIPPGGKGVPKGGGVRLRAAGAADKLPGHQGGDGGEGGHQPLVQRALGGRGEVLLRDGKGVLPGLLGGQVVIETGQHLALGGHLKVHTAETVDDAAVAAAENQVGVAADGLQNQGIAALLAPLVGGVDVQRDHPLQRCLGHFYDTAPGQVFSQQHTEHGGLGGVVPQQGRHVEAGLVGAGAQQQAAIAPQQQNHLIPGGLLNLLDAAAHQLGRQLRHHGGEANGVQRHYCSPPIIASKSWLIRSFRPSK